MQQTLLEHNEKMLILTDHQARLPYTIIQSIADKVSRRGILVSRQLEPEDLNWEAIYQRATMCLNRVPPFAEEEEETAALIIRPILENVLPPFVIRSLDDYNTGSSMRAHRGSNEQTMYRQLVRGHRGATHKEGAAILAAELSAQGLRLAKSTAHLHIEVRSLSRALTDHFLQDADETAKNTWANLTERQKNVEADAYIPALRPLILFLIDYFRAASTNWVPTPVN